MQRPRGAPLRLRKAGPDEGVDEDEHDGSDREDERAAEVDEHGGPLSRREERRG